MKVETSHVLFLVSEEDKVARVPTEMFPAGQPTTTKFFVVIGWPAKNISVGTLATLSSSETRNSTCEVGTTSFA